MKRLLCLFLGCCLLCGCAGPAFRAGYYLLPLEESYGSPVYIRLEEGGTGYLHAMGSDQELTWTPEGLSDLFSDCVPTSEGLVSGKLSFAYSTDLPPEYEQPTLRPGYYLPQDEALASLLTYALLRSDGTGTFSIMGMTKEIEWKDTGFFFGDMIICATREGFLAKDTVPVNYSYVGESLPEYYK